MAGPDDVTRALGWALAGEIDDPGRHGTAALAVAHAWVVTGQVPDPVQVADRSARNTMFHDLALTGAIRVRDAVRAGAGHRSLAGWARAGLLDLDGTAGLTVLGAWAQTRLGAAAGRWWAAGYSPAEAQTVASLPDGHPDRPTDGQLAVMAGIAGRPGYGDRPGVPTNRA